MIVTFYQHKQRHRREEPACNLFSPSSPFETPPPPIVQPAPSGRPGPAPRPTTKLEWQKQTMAVLCGNFRRRHQQPYNAALEHAPCDSDSDGDFYYFYPHKVKDRSASIGESQP